MDKYLSVQRDPEHEIFTLTFGCGVPFAMKNIDVQYVAVTNVRTTLKISGETTDGDAIEYRADATDLYFHIIANSLPNTSVDELPDIPQDVTAPPFGGEGDV